MYPPSIQKLIDLFSKFPTVGPCTAARFVFYLLGKPEKEVEALLQTISVLKAKIKVCPDCFNPFESKQSDNVDFCEICSDKTRLKTLLCVVASESDLQALEKTKKYKGLYFVLGKRISELEQRIKDAPEIKEIILALNPTTEGQATALHLERVLAPFGKKITRLGRGLPVGGELEYADEETLTSALESRK